MGLAAPSPFLPRAPPSPEALRLRLRGAFGRRQASSLSALDRLILGSAGADRPGAEKAAEALKRGFKPWSRLAKAPPELVAAALRPIEPDLGRALARAERVLTVVRRLILRSGGTSLDFLGALPAEEALAWLEDALALPPGLALRVLAAHPLRHRVMRLEPAASRVLARLGHDEAGGTVTQALLDAAPEAWTGEDLEELASLLLALGDALCLPARPDCEPCPLAEVCPSGVAARTEQNRNNSGGMTAFLRRRLQRLEGSREGLVRPGLRLGSAAFGEANLPRGLMPGTHQAAPLSLHHVAAPLILPLATAAAIRAPSGAPGRQEPRGAGVGVRLLVVQEADALAEHGELFAPGLKALGLEPLEVAFVRVGSGAEVLRVVDEALKLKAAPVIAAEFRRGGRAIDLAASRRLGLSARRAGVWLWLITPDLSNTSAALTRWRVGAAPSNPAGRRRLGAPAFTLDLVRNRQGPTGAWTLEWDVHEHRFHTSNLLGRPAEPPRFGAVPAPAPAAPLDRPLSAEAGECAAA